jgi:hypothetical protein
MKALRRGGVRWGFSPAASAGLKAGATRLLAHSDGQSILGRSLDMIDDEHIDRRLRGSQRQTELLAECPGKRGARVVRRGARRRRRRIGDGPLDGEVEISRQPGVIEDAAIHVGKAVVGQQSRQTSNRLGTTRNSASSRCAQSPGQRSRTVSHRTSDRGEAMHPVRTAGRHHAG